MASEIRAKMKVLCGTYDFLSEPGNSCAHTTFCFFNFTNIIDFLIYTFHEIVRNSLLLHIFKNSAYNYTALTSVLLTHNH